MFTFARITAPTPIFAPNARSNSTRHADGQGRGFWKNRQRVTTQSASFQRGAPLSKSELLKRLRSTIAQILHRCCGARRDLALMITGMAEPGNSQGNGGNSEAAMLSDNRVERIDQPEVKRDSPTLAGIDLRKTA